jgi:hypothetical protein
MGSEQGPGSQVADNAARNRFELPVGTAVAFADYRRRPGVVEITHVETPPALRGGGVAARLMQGVMESARRTGVKVAPLCSYAQAFVRRHPEYKDLVD